MIDQTAYFLAEYRHGKFDPVTFELIARCRKLSESIGAVILGCNVAQSALEQLRRYGVGKIILADSPELMEFSPRRYGSVLAEICVRNGIEILLAGATTCGRTLLPYTAMLLHTGLTADCTELGIEVESGLLLQTRPAIGGNIMATIKCPVHRPQMATIRPHSTPLAEELAQEVRPCELHRHMVRELPPQVMTLEKMVSSSMRDDLAHAERVVAIGRGLKNPEYLPLIYDFARALKASVGATREVVDRGWLDYPHQIGLSGKTVSPELYVGIGLSGAIQHTAGMRNAGKIVAINRDPDSPIFQIADLGIVGDLFTVLPQLIEELKKGELSW